MNNEKICRGKMQTYEASPSKPSIVRIKAQNAGEVLFLSEFFTSDSQDFSSFENCKELKFNNKNVEYTFNTAGEEHEIL